MLYSAIMRRLRASALIAGAAVCAGLVLPSSSGAQTSSGLPRSISGNALGAVLPGSGSKCPNLERQFEKAVCLTDHFRKIRLVNVTYSLDAMDGITFDDLLADLELRYGFAGRHAADKVECMGYDDKEKNSKYSCAVWDRGGVRMMLYLRRHGYTVQGKALEEYSYGWTIMDSAPTKAR
jgi:hypothetical protein